ncbi:MAG: NYN domain-containing protein [Hyphomonadaceae bacterium]
MFFPQRRSALLVDFENLFHQCGKERFVNSIDHWLAWLEQGAFEAEPIKRNFLVKEVFWNTQHDIHRLEFQRRRFRPTVCRAIRKEKASSADFDITIRAAELRHEFKNRLQEIIILSLDSDFSSVLHHLQLHDIIGVGMTDPATQFSPNFRNIVDVVIEKADFEQAFQYQPPRRGWFGRYESVVAPLPPAPAANDRAPRRPTAEEAPAPRLDYAKAAKLVAQHAEANGFRLIGRERVKRLLSALPGFHRNGRPWGGGAYHSVLQALVARDSRFSIERKDGGVVLAFDADAQTRVVAS